ncbi:MAG: hypothetical protein B7X53_01255 [Hyphomonas sp. 34-62-18]|nr:MAG: hypothetical protein B7X53_01255 [Hyphomonas sp. 34-62-18]
MNTMNKDTDRIGQAGRWYAELQSSEIDDATWSAFRAWEEDPENAAAFREVEAALSSLDAASPAFQRQGIADAPDAQAAAAKPAGKPLRQFAGITAAAIAASALLVAGIGYLSVERDTYETALGEQRTIELSDGSTLTLNTNSAVEIAYSGSRRFVRLARGEALFEVAKDEERPFQVVAAGSLTTATGTVFDIHARDGEVAVTLLSGGVMVQDRPGSGPLGALFAQDGQRWSLSLTPGQQAVVGADIRPVVNQVDAEAFAKWRAGIVQFTDAPLSEVVRELNRYSEIKLAVDDPALGAERLSGSFPTGNHEVFLSTLALFMPITTERERDLIRIQSAHTANP